jgi:Zn-dependent protease
MGKRITLFHLSGFPIRIDASWLILAALVTWSLARGYFPTVLPELASEAYWYMGAAGALGLFVSIILHELAHAVVARRVGIRMKGITLFIFGGVAEMENEPPNADAEIKMAIAGPIASLLVGVGLLRRRPWESAGASVTLTGVLKYLAFINVVLAMFNMVPAFPLDGGRVLRGILWKSGKNLQRATGITSAIGASFGFMLILLGLFSLFSGNCHWRHLVGADRHVHPRRVASLRSSS